MNSRTAWIASGAIILGVFSAWGAARTSFGTTWTVNFGDPGRDGSHTTTIEISYIDPQGAKKYKTIEATTPITDNMSEDAKATAVKGAVNAALAAPANKVGGNSLASTGGTGDVMTATPAGDSSSFTDAKIESVETDDSETGEDDKITKPTAPAVAVITAEGEIIGEAGTSPSDFQVITDVGVVTVSLTGSMRKVELLRNLAEGLQAQGAVCWVDSGREQLLVLLEDAATGGVSEIGAGSTDDGLHAVCTVIVQ